MADPPVTTGDALPRASSFPLAAAGEVALSVRNDRSAPLPLTAADLIERCEPRVTRLVHRLMGWHADSADVVQDVFIAAWRALPRFRGDAALETWVCRIAVNTCRTARRRRWLRAVLRLEAAADVPAPSASPETPAATAERDAAVRHAVRQLPAAYREVVVLHYLEGLPLAEVAELVGSPAGTVAVRLHRARAMLRTRLDGWMTE